MGLFDDDLLAIDDVDALLERVDLVSAKIICASESLLLLDGLHDASDVAIGDEAHTVVLTCRHLEVGAEALHALVGSGLTERLIDRLIAFGVVSAGGHIDVTRIEFGGGEETGEGDVIAYRSRSRNEGNAVGNKFRNSDVRILHDIGLTSLNLRIVRSCNSNGHLATLILRLFSNFIERQAFRFGALHREAERCPLISLNIAGHLDDGQRITGVCVCFVFIKSLETGEERETEVVSTEPATKC